MKTTKKTLLLALCLMLTVSILAACGGNNNEPANSVSSGGSSEAASEQPSDSQKEPVNLTMWGGVPEESGPKAAVDAWNAEHPDIQVEYVRYVNDDAGNLKLDTALISGEDVDLWVNYGQDRLGKRIDAGAALDLGQFTDYNIDDIMGPDAKDVKIDDKYYGLPTTAALSFVWLNKNALDEAALPIPPLDWTMADLQQYAKALKKDNVWGYVNPEDSYWNNLDGSLNGVYEVDGKSNFDQAPVRSTLETWYNMIHTDTSVPTYGEQISTKMDVAAMFLKGESAMLGAGTWIFRNSNDLTNYPREFKIAFAPIPKPLKDQPSWAVGGGVSDVVSINAKRPHANEAWEFLKWYADEGVMYLASGGRIPASKNADKEKAMELMLNGVEDLYDMDSLKSVVFGNSPVYTSKLDVQTRDALKEELSKYLLQNESLDEMLGNFVKRHNEILAK